MKCRKCGNEIPDDSIRCSNCGIKVNMYCPECKSLNPFGSQKCSKCGFELLKICPECGCKNLYSMDDCRKCGYKFNQEEQQDNVIDVEVETNEILEQDIVRSFSATEPAFTPVVEPQLQVVENVDETEEKKVDVPQEKEQVVRKFFNVDEDYLPHKEELDVTEPQEVIVKQVTAQEIAKELEQDVEVFPLEEIVDENVEESIRLENETSRQEEEEELSRIEVQPEIVKKVVHVIKTSITKQVIALQGIEGCGKTAILKQVSNHLTSKGYVFLYGSCTPLVQITSFGFFQDAFLRIMGFPPFTKTTEAFIKDFKKSNFANLFNFLDGNELSLFLNIFYPSQKDNFDDILENKKIMFGILEKVIKSFSLNNNLVITIDNFELLDGASYDFIVHMMEKGYFNNRLKLLVAYQEDKSIQSYFDISKADERIFEMIKVKKFTNEEILDVVKNTLSLDIKNIMDKAYLDELLKKSDGNALRFEQEIALLFNSNYISLKGNDILINEDNKPEIDPVSFEELIKLRLHSLSPTAKNVLFMSAIMGYRFATSILCLSVTMPVEKAGKILDFLIQEQFLQRVDNYTCEFKSLTLWKLIYQEAKSDLLYKENSERLYLSLKPLILSSNLQKLISCTEAISKNEAFLIWQETASISAKLGDTNLYVISQKQCLKILEEQNLLNAEELKAEIYEQIGKLLCEKSPKEAVTYLANVLDSEIKAGNLNKIIDLSGYFVKSCYLSGNYFGAAEAVDAVVSNIEESEAKVSDTDIALIKTRKLKALFNIGNSEQIINLVNEDIMPDLERGLEAKQVDSKYKSLLVDAWLNAKTILAKAYAIQGNNQVFNVITSLKQFLDKYSYNTEFYTLQIALLEAFANTITGEINKSNEILNQILLRTKNTTLEPELLSEWNLINVINRILLNENDGLKADLFELAAFTNNINEHFMKNIIKLILGYVLKEEGNTLKALEIFNEEITYFAKEKVAIGALLSWLLIVQISIETDDEDKALTTATKSLEIAQSPKINNYFFVIYFQKYIAEIYLRKGDFTAAKMYLEQAIMLAKQYDLKYQIIELYIAYGNYMEDFMKVTHNYSSNNVEITNDMYNKALNSAKELRLNNMIDRVNREKSDFKTFCQLNSIG